MLKKIQNSPLWRLCTVSLLSPSVTCLGMWGGICTAVASSFFRSISLYWVFCFSSTHSYFIHIGSSASPPPIAISFVSRSAKLIRRTAPLLDFFITPSPPLIDHFIHMLQCFVIFKGGCPRQSHKSTHLMWVQVWPLPVPRRISFS